MKKILDVDNKVLYNTAKSQSKIFCILAYTKMKNFDKSEHF
jgi:hypothetical protein